MKENWATSPQNEKNEHMGCIKSEKHGNEERRDLDLGEGVGEGGLGRREDSLVEPGTAGELVEVVAGVGVPVDHRLDGGSNLLQKDDQISSLKKRRKEEK